VLGNVATELRSLSLDIEAEQAQRELAELTGEAG
jgi:hypothetical protein